MSFLNLMECIYQLFFYSMATTYLDITWNRALTGRRFRDEILKPVVVPYSAAIGDNFMLIDDNCRLHPANLDLNGELSENWRMEIALLQE